MPERFRMEKKGTFRVERIFTHLLLGGLIAALYLLIVFLAPEGKQYELLLILLGYLSLLLIGVTLLIGPLNMLRSRLHRNPVNIYLRRDVGIWAGITGCGHTLLVLRGNIANAQILQFFLRLSNNGYSLLLTVYGVSNDFGLFAVLLLCLLLALSNTASLRWLKGKRWKRWQRLTYLLALFAVAHTLGFQYVNLRGSLFQAVVIALVTLIVIGQTVGILVTLLSQRRRSQSMMVGKKREKSVRTSR